MSEKLEDWACAELDSLGLPDAAVIIQYLEPLDNAAEVEEYLNSMLDISQTKHKKFIKEFLDRQASSKVDKRFYRKSDIVEPSGLSQGKKKGNKSNNQGGIGGTISAKSGNQKGNASATKEREKKSLKKSNSTGEKENRNDNDKKRASPPLAANVPPPAATAQPPQTQGKKKTKFVNLYSEDGTNRDVVLLGGRNVCECLASKHKLINNCLSCGRIVCEQEGAGPCFFCGNMVQSKEQTEGCVVASKFDIIDKPQKSKPVSVKDVAADIQRAVDHKNKLLEYDRTSEKRTKVYDDESDYFNSNSKWLSKADREVLQARENELRRKKYDRTDLSNTVTIDILGRKIITDDTNDAGVYDPNDPVIKAILEREPDDIFAAYQKNNLLPPQELKRPVYVETIDKQVNVDKPLKFPMTAGGNKLQRLQDRELQEMSDQGKCLSMHQPWASLLMEGIKMHEGRTWYSAHRGRLWISSAAKVPTQEEIKSVEDFYQNREGGGDLVFPQHYPPGCLLGCVDVVDILPQEEYRVKFPKGESDSPFVFICQTPMQMIFKFPMKGEHKIFSLESKLHQAAKKALK